MKMPDDYIKKILGYSSITDLIENLYLSSLIEANNNVSQIDNIADFSENEIRNEFEYEICFKSEKLSNFIANRTIFLGVENQIIKEDKQKKRTDIEFNIPFLKFIIECKKVKSVSKTQYIDSGISRFIDDEYTNENDKFAGMCSFIVQNDVNKLISGIKEKVKQYKFLKINHNPICNFSKSFSSIHQKNSISEIFIYHLFFDMRKDEW